MEASREDEWRRQKTSFEGEEDEFRCTVSRDARS